MQLIYDADVFIYSKHLRDIAYKVDATYLQVKVWFQNKRQRANLPRTKWYENKRDQDPTTVAPVVLPEQSSPLDERQSEVVDSLLPVPNNQLFFLPYMERLYINLVCDVSHYLSVFMYFNQCLITSWLNIW